MKKFLSVMAGIFAILTIILYYDSIKQVSYSGYSMQVANIQATVFAAASAILCGVNLVGAILYNLIEELQYHIKYQNSNTDTKPTPSSVPSSNNQDPSTITSNSRASLKPVSNNWICKKCGTKNTGFDRFCIGCGEWK